MRQEDYSLSARELMLFPLSEIIIRLPIELDRLVAQLALHALRIGQLDL